MSEYDFIFLKHNKTMKFKIKKADLHQALDLASRFVSRNWTLPVLENVAISGNIDTLELKATDMNKYIHLTMPAKIESEWAITVNAKMFLDAIRFAESEEIELEWKDDWTFLTLLSWKDKFDFKWISINEYIAIPNNETGENFEISPELLSKWIERVDSSIADKSFTTIITWMLLKWTWSEIAFVWTDSFRLSEYKIAQEIWKEFDIVIPKNTLSEIKKVSDLMLQEDSTKNIKISFDKKLINFSFEIWDFNIEIKTNLIQWVYPDYEKIILPSYNSKMIIDKTNLEKAIKKASLFSKDMNYFVKFTPWEDQLVIWSSETDLGEWSAQIPAIIDWDVKLWLNWKSVLDFLKYVDWEEVIFNIFDDEKPILIKDQGDENYKFVLRPLKSWN